MSDSVRPHRWQPTRLPCPWDSPGKNTGVGCHFLLQCMQVKSESEVTQSCPTLSNPVDCSPPGSSIHGIFQARVLEWGAIAFPFIFLGSKITAGGDCGHEIKRRLLLGRKVMTNLDSILKSRVIALPTKVHLSESYGFSSIHVWMWELDYKENWAPKNWCFWTMVLEKTLESPLDCKEVQPAHPKGDQSWVCIGRTVLKLKLQYFGHLMRRADSFEKTLMLERLKVGGEGDDRGWDSWMASPTRWTWVWVNSGSWWWTGRPGVL